MSDAVVRVSSLRKTFPREAPLWRAALRKRDRITVLSDVSFEVPKGTILSILGANGAGKSTLLGVIAGMLHPDAGTVELDGTVGLSASVDRSFYYRLTLRENLRFFGVLSGLRGRRLERRIDELLEFVDLLPYADLSFANCSTGTRQRAMVAQALLKDPSIILLDEPTRALDPVHTAHLHQFIRERLVAQENKTVLMATNVLDEAWTISDHVALLSGGKLLGFDHPDRLRERATKVARYRVCCHPIDETLLERVRSSARCVVVPQNDSILIDVEWDPSALTSVLRAIVSDGVRVSAVSREEPPATVFFEQELYASS